MVTIQFWDAPFQVGSHQIARQFLQSGWEVAYISAPLTPLHLLKINDPITRERFKVHQEGRRRGYGGKLWTYIPFSLIAPDLRPVLSWRAVAENWHRYTIPRLTKVIRQAGFDSVDLLYLDSIYQPFWLDKISCRKSILRIHDANSAFRGFSKGLKEVEVKIAGAVDSVVYTANALEGYVQALHPKQAVYVPNGVNCSFFNSGSRDVPLEYKEISSPIAVYVGAMGEWFDFDLVNDVALSLPDIAFVFIGPDPIALEKLQSLSNIHLLGVKKYQELAPYLHNADVGIIPFKVWDNEELISSVNPLKLYEYMACGLPVASTSWKELRLINSPAFLCDTHAEFVSAIRKSVDTITDKSTFIDYAEKHDWKESFKKLLAIIE